MYWCICIQTHDTTMAIFLFAISTLLPCFKSHVQIRVSIGGFLTDSRRILWPISSSWKFVLGTTKKTSQKRFSSIESLHSLVCSQRQNTRAHTRHLSPDYLIHLSKDYSVVSYVSSYWFQPLKKDLRCNRMNTLHSMYNQSTTSS